VTFIAMVKLNVFTFNDTVYGKAGCFKF